jgi:predicted ATPase/class 3 adenylate cyclase/DNA-binding CsgD family transcriptional regulator
MPRTAPEGTVTLLFTDIEDAARLWADAPEDTADAVQAHDAIVRSAIERHDGYLLAVGNDGFRAAFSTAASAAAAAIDAQRLLTEDDRITVAARMGLHTGEVVRREQTYLGSDVNRAARLVALAHGGQILVSETTEILLRRAVALRPLGEHRLPGLRGRMSVHQVVAAGLPTEFPVLRSRAGFEGNLPQRLSSFVGREDLVGAVADQVRSTRLITLSGVAGVGKTRLALEVGAELSGEFPDGVWMIELASVGDASSVPAAIATVLGIAPQGGLPLIDVVADSLAGRRLLLIVDNCEHVLAAAVSAVEAILGRSETVRLLATSRERLEVDGEAALTVQPLALDGGATSDAVSLFVDRARTVRPDFGLHDQQTVAAVLTICETLDGLPLGIELAAARMAAMNAVEIRDRLADRFRLLKISTGGPQRQRTLHLAVDWSYTLLTADEQHLLCTASVFAGGFDLAGICAVVEGPDEVEILGQLESLVRKSLVAADHTTAHTRYAMYETIREFAADRLIETDRHEHARARHAAHFARTAVARWEHWNGPGWRDAVDWVETELGNLRSAFRWSARQDDLEVATDVAAHAALMGFSVQLFETIAWAEELLEAATAADVRRLPRLYTAAGLACFAGRAEAARAHAHRACELEGDPRYEACEPGYATFIEALGQVYCGDLDRYVELTGAVASKYGRERGYGLAAYVDGLQSAGRTDEALALTEESVAAARELGNPYWISYALWIAGLALSKADARRALAAWDEGVAFVREHRVHFFDGFLARDAARLHTSDGEPAVALGLFDDAIAAFHRAGNVPQLIITLASVPVLFERLDRLVPAATLLGAMSRQPSSLHHVPELRDVSDRLGGQLGTSRLHELTSDGAGFDLNAAADYARRQIGAARRDPMPGARPAHPGGLSRRELEVLRLVADGRTAAEIATQLFISSRTAEHHIQHIYTKIDVSSRASATRWAIEHQVVDVSARRNR